jgi:hypothetical protein
VSKLTMLELAEIILRGIAGEGDDFFDNVSSKQARAVVVEMERLRVVAEAARRFYDICMKIPPSREATTDEWEYAYSRFGVALGIGRRSKVQTVKIDNTPQMP